jgi:hypothetical protein
LWSEMGVAAAGSQLRMVRILPRLPGGRLRVLTIPTFFWS